jgi:hypothetical protein
MSLVLFSFFGLANYYLLFVLPTKIARKQLLIGLLLCFVAYHGFSELLIWFRVYPFVVGATQQSVWANFLSSIQSLIVLSLANQLSHTMIGRVVTWHQENNVENLPRQPIRFTVEQKSTIQKAFTIGWLASSLVVFGGIWLRA